MKILKIFLLIVILFISAAFAAPFMFKSKIMELAKKQINKNLTSVLDFKDVDISFFRHFPKVSVALVDPQLIGTGEFSSDTLFSAKQIDVALNFMSVVKGSDYKVYSITVNNPRIHALVHKNGVANWNITAAGNVDSSKQQKSSFSLDLEKYTIRNGHIFYDDESSGIHSEISGLNHEGRGDFNSANFILHTITSASSVNFSYGAISYFSNAKAEIESDINVDSRLNKYSFKTKDVQINDLRLNTEGFFQLINDSIYNMDIAFKAPSTDFRNLLSLIPSIYQHNFNSVKTSGKAIISGFFKGIYGNGSIPSYNLNLNVKNGFFQYADLPKSVKNINFSLIINNPDGITDHSEINIPQGHIEIDNQPLDFRFLMKNPLSDLFVDLTAKGNLDLSHIKDYMKLENGTDINGLVNANISVNGSVNAIEKKEYNKLNAFGTIGLEHFSYVSSDYPEGIKLNSVVAGFTPQNLNLSNVSGQFMGTSFTGSGTIDNILQYVLKNKPLKGSLNVSADQVNLDKWMNYSTDTTAQSKSASAFVVPDNLDIILNSTISKVHYEKTDLNNVSGTLHIKDETVFLENVKANAFDGTIAMNGLYSTKINKKQPDISLAYDVSNLDIQKTFTAFNTVQKLMPIAAFIDGKLNSHLTLTGRLGDNMMPDMNSLTGNGNLLLIQGVLKKFAPLEKLASTLNVDKLKDISLKDIKNYIEFSNGKVLIRPFTAKVNNMEMEIGGLHGFDQSMDYNINMKIPRSYFGSEGNNLLNNLAQQSANKGIPIKLSDNVNLKVNMTGSIKNPVIRTDLKQMGSSLKDDIKQQLNDYANSKKLEIRNAIKDSAASVKNSLISSAKTELASKLLGNKDSSSNTKPVDLNDVRKKTEDIGKGLINGFFKKKKADSTSH